ncbi:unnamed protein product [Phytophthora fragariaefolia]|uniref:Unnamed protein product n=1 Tax=Phytophthora fragariaefolia TaxID=1490495 RepID=A0A9W6YDD5_9STRA|nr:unnamed protein product [Phytophthora fragariaefolia]GMF60016.1 unnamed protein product [Phytophthora fragariaefolia]
MAVKSTWYRWPTQHVMTPTKSSSFLATDQSAARTASLRTGSNRDTQSCCEGVRTVKIAVNTGYTNVGSVSIPSHWSTLSLTALNSALSGSRRKKMSRPLMVIGMITVN